jgi:hypothetical protein
MHFVVFVSPPECGTNSNVKIYVDNKSSDNLAKFKYAAMSRLNFENDYNHSEFLSSHLLLKNINDSHDGQVQNKETWNGDKRLWAQTSDGLLWTLQRKLRVYMIYYNFFFFLWPYSQIQALAASMKLTVSLQLLDLGQSVGLLGRVISSSQGLCLYVNTEKRTHNTNTKHPSPEWDSNSRSRRPRERRQFMPYYYN